MNRDFDNIRNRKIADESFGGYELPKVKSNKIVDSEYYESQQEKDNAWLDMIAEQISLGQSISDMLCVDLSVSI